MNLHIENAKKTFFNDKEHYLQFKAAWKKAVNSPKTKSKLETTEAYSGGTCVVRRKGWITATHHLIYNLLRGYDASRGFTPVTNKNKLTNDAYINHGLYEAYWYARYYASRDEFLKPFDGTVTKEMMSRLVEAMPEIKPIYSNMGNVGPKVAKKLLKIKQDQGKAYHPTYEDLWNLYEEVKNEDSRTAA